MPKTIKIPIVSRFLFTMNVVTILFLVGCALSVNALPSRIVGGNDAPIGKYPFQASLRYYNRHFCGGSIINKRYILTAAHCIVSYRNLQYFTVHVGTNFLNETGNSYNVSQVVTHKDYDGYALLNDIGLVRLDKDIEYNEKVQPIEMAETDFAGEGHSCIAIGWGTTRLGGSAPNSLQELDLFIESQQKCADLHWRVKESHICTFIKFGKGLCHGDSGGPLIADGAQVGIVSFGQPCAVGYPDVFTRVSSFHDWVHDNMYGV